MPRRLFRRRFPHHHLSDGLHRGRSTHTAEVKVLYDEIGNTLTVWFGNPADEDICEETGEEVVLMKNKQGHVIGFEKLNYVVERSAGFQVGFQTAGAAVAPRQGQERTR